MKSKLIVARDVDSLDRASTRIEELRNTADIFRVGRQLFTLAGPRIVAFINEQANKWFVDLRFHDVPNTVAKAVESAKGLHVFMLTLHASDGAPKCCTLSHLSQSDRCARSWAEN